MERDSAQHTANKEIEQIKKTLLAATSLSEADKKAMVDGGAAAHTHDMLTALETKMKELCKGQANRAWFSLRRFCVTSSTACKVIKLCARSISQDVAVPEAVSDALKICARYLAIDLNDSKVK